MAQASLRVAARRLSLHRAKRNASKRANAPVRSLASFSDFSWHTAAIATSERASANGQLVSINLSVSSPVLAPFSTPGQFVQLKLSEEQEKPSFMAVATAPPESSVAEGGTMGLLVKVVPDTPAEELCKLPPGAEILVSPVMGPGFPIEQLSDTSQVFLVCTGSGLAPIKSLIESDALQGKNRHSITLVYGVHSKEHNPCTDDTLASWQSHFNVDTVLVYSDEGHGYVQDELKRRKENIDGAQAGACLCGQKEMVQDVKSVLSEAGVPEEKMLLNF